MNKYTKTGLAIITAIYLTFTSASVSAATPAELYDDVWKIVNKKYYDPSNNSQDWAKWRYRYQHKLKTKEDAYVAIDTMLASLNDPYTRFLQPKEFSEETQSIKGSLKGIGTQIGLRDGNLVIIAPLEDSPAERAGLLADDQILEINGESTKGINIDVAADKIRGEKGTTVTLLIQRKGVPNKLYSIVRDEIEIKSVSTKPPIETTIPNDIQYIRLSSFISKNAAVEIEEILNKSSDKKGFIIDLRSNPGGLLTNAIYISDMLLKGGIIVSTVDRDRYKSTTRARYDQTTEKPVVVLINKGSASASEILSGALKDNHRATIIGEQSFGKGLVQEINKLPDEAGMNITIQRYLTPSGTDIHKKGITPDVVVELTKENVDSKNDVQLKKAIEVLEHMTCLVQKSGI
ncbi:MAG: S41 family peptidase [bacterium]|nr:S41 family peptidase [bacterium]